MSDYPDEQELATLRSWSGTPADLVAFLRDSAWWSPDWGLRVTDGNEFEPEKLGNHGTGHNFRWLHLSTGGWSGNEERIYEMQHSGRMMTFWSRYWHTTRVGGHYLFRIPIEQWDTPIDSFELPRRPTPAEELAREAVELIVTHAYGTQTPEQVRDLFAAEHDMAEIRVAHQTFGSTTGPFSGYGGSALTTFRVVAVKLGGWIAWHLGDSLAFVTAYDDTTEKAWRDGRIPNHRDVLGSIAPWCPSNDRQARR